MDTRQLLLNDWTQVEQKLFSLLCLRAGESLSQREIAQLLHVSPTAIANSIPKLIDAKLITLTKTKTINFISLNRDEKSAIESKRVENLENFYTCGLSEYLEAELAGSTIVLFGSYSRGEDVNQSDIDIAIIGRAEKTLALSIYESKLHRKINVNYYKTLRAINVNLRSNICNGIVIHGSICL